MTENERYQGKLYAGKTSENKGQKKQDDWVQVKIGTAVTMFPWSSCGLTLCLSDFRLIFFFTGIISSPFSPPWQNIQDYVAAGKAGHAAGLVHKLLAYPNIPRKKNKFFNFVSNCMAVRRPEDVERVWTVIVEANQRNDRQEGESKMKQQSNGTKRLIPEDEVVGEPAADKKRIRKGVGGENENGSTVQSDLPNRVVCEQSNFNDSNTVHRGDVSASCQDEKNDSAHTGEQKFSWKKTIKRLVREHEEQSLHLKDLKRQVSQSIDFR